MSTTRHRNTRRRFYTNTSIDPETLTAYREEEGWTQTELARRVGVSNTVVWQWERGWTNPNSANLDKLAEVFGVSRAALSAE